MRHSGGGRLRRVLLRGSTVTGSSLEVLLEEASPTYVLGACSHGLSLKVTNLSLAFSEDMSEQPVGWPGHSVGPRSFTWRGIPSTVRFCALVIPVTRPTLYFVVHRPCGAFTHTRSPGWKTEGMYAQQNRSWTLHSSWKVLNRLLRKVVTLSVRISVGGPRS